MTPKLKNDRYRSSRGGSSRFLDLICEHCDTHLCYYQKDGPGALKRMYLDRIIDGPAESKSLVCPRCQRLLGIWYVYDKESRSAYRLFVGAVRKKIVSRTDIT